VSCEGCGNGNFYSAFGRASAWRLADAPGEFAGVAELLRRIGRLDRERVARDEARDSGRIQLVLAAKVMIERAARQSGGGHDLADGDLFEAVAIEQAARGFDDAGACPDGMIGMVGHGVRLIDIPGWADPWPAGATGKHAPALANA